MTAAASARALALALVVAAAAPPPVAADDVTSIKATGQKGGPIIFQDPPDGFSAQNTTVAELIRMAYSADFQRPLEGAPSWVFEDRFDLTIKSDRRLPAAAPGSSAPRQAMVRTMLAERFRLATHIESRELPIYALVLARPDRSPGPRLTPAVDCAGPCIATGFGFFKAQRTTLANFGMIMSGRLGRRVEDRTGLTGTFAIDLEYAPLQTPSSDTVPPDSARPSLFTAVQEQLGLKLEATQGPVDVLVIDHIERPDAN